MSFFEIKHSCSTYVSTGPRHDHRVRDSDKRGAKIFLDATDCVTAYFSALAGTNGYWIVKERL